MQIQYVIINFLILALLLFIVGRKTVAAIFRKHSETVNAQLDEAEAAESLTEPVFEEFTGFEISDSHEAEKEAARALVNEKLEHIAAFRERECREIHRKMIVEARKELFASMKKTVADIVSREPYLSRIKAMDKAIAEAVLERIALTPGDLTYLRQHDVLYVTLTSAFPLDEEIVRAVDEKTTAMLNEVNGKTSLWVLEDPELIGGLKLRIGDTLYDGTVAEELYHFEKSLSRDPVDAHDAANELIKEFSTKAEGFATGRIHTYQLGRVMSVSDGICWMDGLADIMYGEVVEFDCGERGMVLDIQHDRIGCVIFGEYEHIDCGSRVRRVGRIASVPVGNALLGRVVDSLGNPIDGDGYLSARERRPIEFNAPGIPDRSPVNAPLHTGIKAIDALVPIGKGQRELIIGDRQTGKTAIAIDAIINQKNKNTICIYVAIGQKDSLVAEMREKLASHGAMEYTTIVASPASSSAALQYIAPFAATAMGEHFMYQGKDVLIVYDDLSKHAVAYRELSLLLHRPSGREAYPGDIFYLHSRLLERSAHLSEALGSGSMTALPIIETLAGDISAYIPTNVISITDGQIFLESELFYEGQRPAVNVGLSVSRVGGAAQSKLMKQVASNLRARLAQYRELADFMQFGTDIDKETKNTLDTGRMLTEALKQGRYNPIPDYLQAALIYAVSEGFAKNIKPEQMEEFEQKLYSYLRDERASLLEELATGRKMSSETKTRLNNALQEFSERF